MLGWLVKRLTPHKAQEDRWVSLAASLENVWEGGFDPELSRLERLRSYFRADDADLAAKLREMGDYFTVDMPHYNDRPISVAWRKLELEYKDLELILFSMFRRHYGNLDVLWFPLFAPNDEEYGTKFIPSEGPWPDTDKNAPFDGTFLTSRGLLGADFGHILKMGLNKAAFLETALPLLHRAKPLHIVYDGALFYIKFPIDFEIDDFSSPGIQEMFCDFPFSVVGARFDYTAADVRNLDTQSLSFSCETEEPIEFLFMGRPEEKLWHLDWRIPEGLPHGWLPLDFVLTGHEGENVLPVRAYMYEHQYNFDLPMIQPEIKSAAREREIYLRHNELKYAQSIETNHGQITIYYDTPPNTILYPNFDEIPADFCPLDMPIGGLSYV